VLAELHSRVKTEFVVGNNPQPPAHVAPCNRGLKHAGQSTATERGEARDAHRHSFAVVPA